MIRSWMSSDAANRHRAPMQRVDRDFAPQFTWDACRMPAFSVLYIAGILTARSRLGAAVAWRRA
jgi:hypothetical protein